MKVQVLIVNCSDGDAYPSVHLDLDSAQGELYDYVREGWAEYFEGDGEPCPDNEDVAINRYFEYVDDEWYTIKERQFTPPAAELEEGVVEMNAHELDAAYAALRRYDFADAAEELGVPTAVAADIIQSASEKLS